MRKIILPLALLLVISSYSYAAALAYRTAVLADNPIGYWEFDETSGTTANDTATTNGGVNNGTYGGSLVLGQTSAMPGLGTAVGFPGTAEVVVGANTAFDLAAGDFTVEMWIRKDNTDRGDLWTYKAGAVDLGIHSNSGNVRVYKNAFVGGSPAVSNATWHHIAVVRESGDWTTYVDGTANVLGTNAGSISAVTTPIIGANTGGNLRFNGLIDEVAFYGSALSQVRIDAHIAAAIPEPSSALLLAFLGCFGLVVRRKR